MHIEKSLARALLADLNAERYEIRESGLYFPRQSVGVRGTYRMSANGGDYQESQNLVTTEGFKHLLNVSLGTTPKPAGYYIALMAGNTSPAANWTAANFASVASEIVSLTEGYTQATRIAWTPANASADTHIDNYGAETEVTFATASSINVTGAALLTASAKGATSGTLVSASLYPAPYTFMDGNTFKVGYRMELTT